MADNQNQQGGGQDQRQQQQDQQGSRQQGGDQQGGNQQGGGNFADDRDRASDAGRKGGQASHQDQR